MDEYSENVSGMLQKWKNETVKMAKEGLDLFREDYHEFLQLSAGSRVSCYNFQATWCTAQSKMDVKATLQYQNLHVRPTDIQLTPWNSCKSATAKETEAVCKFLHFDLLSMVDEM